MTSSTWRLFIPKFFTVLRKGYSLGDFKSDTISGLSVAIVALPLAMALAVAAGAAPARGLYTSIVAGFVISFLGGSRFQIGGPTGAFVVVVFNVIQQFGYEGLVLASLMAGVFLIIAGLARFGTYIKYIPYPVVTGFTAGIAVIIFSSQVKDILGLDMGAVPANFIEKWRTYFTHISSTSPLTLGVALAALGVIIAFRKFAPRWPAFLVAVLGAAVAVWGFGLPVETIGERFGEIPHVLPTPVLPDFSQITLARITALLPSALTIAFLGGVESLLSAVVADGMTGRRHRSNCELVAQGTANIASAIMGGIPATGAIARTATNIRAGARSPVAGMMHAVFLLLFIMLFAPYLSYIPLAALGAILAVVAWNMSEYRRFIHLMSAPAGDRVVLLSTFTLTVLVDLSTAIAVGVVLAAILFMHRMAQVVEIETHEKLIDEDIDDFTDPVSTPYAAQDDLPDGVVMYAINGPFFFGAATRLGDVMDRIGPTPKVFILGMRHVPLMDATGVSAMLDFMERCRHQDIHVILVNVQAQPRKVLMNMCAKPSGCSITFTANSEEARDQAKKLIAPA